LYASVLLVAALMAVALGGDLRKIALIEIKRLPWILVSFALPFAAPLAPRAGLDAGGAAAVVTVLSYGMLFCGLMANLSLPGIPLIGLGSLANLAAVMANSFRMPVSLEMFDPAVKAQEAARLAGSLTHVQLEATTRLAFLADVIPWRLLGGRPSMVSIGDIAIALGAGYLVFRSARPRCFR
jgi:hypothetical protein